MLVVNITYDAVTRLMAVDEISTGQPDRVIGTTADNNGTMLHFTFIDFDNSLELYTKSAQFGSVLVDTEHNTYRPPMMLDENNNVVIPDYIMSHVLRNTLTVQLVFKHGDAETGDVTEFRSLNILKLRVEPAIPTGDMPEEVIRYGDLLNGVTYDPDTSTFTYHQVDGGEIYVHLTDLAEDHFTVPTASDLDNPEYTGDAENGDTATAMDTGVWYKLYIKDGVRNWVIMPGGATQNGAPTTAPVFYAPHLSGTSGQYLESRGENNSPEWVTKITEITGNSDVLPTTTAVKTYVDTNVTAERLRAVGEETRLDGKIDNEISRATQSEQTLQANIDTEAGIRANKDDELQDNIDAEEQARIDEDTRLEGLINSEVARAISAEMTIQSNLTNEMTTREAGDQYLASQIVEEETRATQAEQTLQDSIDDVASDLSDEITNRMNADDNLQSQIDALDSAKQDKMTASNGVKIVGVDIQHTNSITAGDTGSSADSVPKITFDAQGHITAKDTISIQIAESQVTDLETHLDGKAPNNHADAADKYGVGDETKYGHVKVDTSVSASSNNPVRNSAIKSYVDDAVATATANFLGTYNAVSDLGNPQALVDTWTKEPDNNTKILVASQITPALPQGVTPSKNDYVFVSVNKSTTLSEDWFWRFKYNGTTWLYEFYLVNPSFTQVQWDAINSLVSNSGSTGIDVQTIINHIADGTIHVTQSDKDNWNNKVDKLTQSPAGTYPKVTVNAQGQVTSGTTLVESDIPQLSISKITDLQTELDDKLDDDQLVTSFQSTPLDTNIPSEKLVKDSLDAKVDDSQVVTSWSSTTSNDNIPSEKLTKDSLDAKLDDTQLVTAFQQTPDDTHIPSEKLVKDSLDAKLDDTQLVTTWSQTVSDTNIPSEKLVKDSLDEKVKGPTSAVGDNVALFDGTTGKIIKDSGKTLGASIPAPTVADKDKALIVDATGNGFTFGEAGKVDDVQINGSTSIVINKVAKIPITVTDVQITEVD